MRKLNHPYISVLVPACLIMAISGCGSEKPGSDQGAQKDGSGSGLATEIQNSCGEEITIGVNRMSTTPKMSDTWSVSLTYGQGPSLPDSVSVKGSWQGEGERPAACTDAEQLIAMVPQRVDVKGKQTLIYTQIELTHPLESGKLPTSVAEAAKMERIPLHSPESPRLEVSFWAPIEGHYGDHISYGDPFSFSAPAEIKCDREPALKRTVEADKLSDDYRSSDYFGDAYLPDYPDSCDFVVKKLAVKLPTGKDLTVSLSGKVSRNISKKRFELTVSRIELQ